MKRIYMALALIGGLAFGAKAQSIDLEAVIALPSESQTISAHETLDTDKVLCGIIYNGPDNIVAGDNVLFMSSFSRPATTPGSFYLAGVSYNANITAADSGQAIFIFPNSNQIGTGHIAPYKLSSDSINVMFDWQQWNENDSVVLALPPYVNGKDYGFFFRAVRVSDDNGQAIGTDPVPGNNLAVQKIKWSSTTGIQEFAKKENVDINVYPNPASDVINFDFNYVSPSHSTVIVRDITGKTVYSHNYGRQNAGVQKYTIDISKFSAGNYIVELDADNQNAKAKFTIK